MTRIARHYATVYLLINGVGYCYLALLFLWSPREWFANLGIVLTDPLGYTELRAMYSGLMGALGVFFLTMVARREWHAPGLLLAALSYLLLATVRGWGIYVDTLFDDFTLVLLWTEVAGAALALLGLYCLHYWRHQ